eukprot:8399613-Lingulodinium_polyedra.AAC.1
MRRLWAPRTFSCAAKAGPSATWRSALGASSRGDYNLLSMSWEVGFGSVVPDPLVDVASGRCGHLLVEAQ